MADITFGPIAKVDYKKTIAESEVNVDKVIEHSLFRFPAKK